jgi:chorismate synthase
MYLNNGNVQGYTSNGNSAQFRLYPVEAPSSSTIEIPLKTINNATGQAEDVEHIGRNDFINAIVKVSYSKNKGHFTFEVIDWYSGGGDVEFN